LRDTSLQASSGGARTSPWTEPWSAIRDTGWGCGRKWRNSLLGEWAEQRQRWASGGAEGENKRGSTVELEIWRDLAVATPRDGFPFYTPTDTQRSSQLTEVGTSGVIRRWPHRAR
jgi:hypothetical protein